MGETLKVGLDLHNFGLLHRVVAALESDEFRLLPLDAVPATSDEVEVVVSDAAQLPVTCLPVIALGDVALLPLQLRHVRAGRPPLVIGVDPGGLLLEHLYRHANMVGVATDDIAQAVAVRKLVSIAA